METDETHVAQGMSPADERTVRAVVAAFFRVYNGLGFGFLEAVYARALAVELVGRGLAFEREHPIAVRYRGHVVGEFRADFLVERSLVVELKTGVKVRPADRAQLVNYLAATGVRSGLLLHFGEEPVFLRVTMPSRGSPCFS